MDRTYMRAVGTRHQRMRGFTLIEVMIVVVIVAILASIALPSYRAYIVRAHENVAKAQLTDLTSLQQSYFNDRRRFAVSLDELGLPASGFLQRDGGLSATSGDNTIYQLSVQDPGVFEYTLRANPVGTQATGSKCGILRLYHDGVRCSEGKSRDDSPCDPNGCW